MADPRISIETIRYKTYVKKTLVNAMRTVFSGHPDAILKKTKVGVDFPFTEAEYPAVVVRFFERTIKSAGVGHTEWIPVVNIYHAVETWFDNFEGLRTELDYSVETGVFPTDGFLIATPFEMIPYKPEWIYGQESIGHGTQLLVTRVANEQITARTGVVANLADDYCVIGEAKATGSNLTLNLIHRDSAGTETIRATVAESVPTDVSFWIETKVTPTVVNAVTTNVVTLELSYDDPLLGSTPTKSLSYTLTTPEESGLVDATRYWVGGSGSGVASYLNTFRTLKTNVENSRFYKHKRYLYNGDIEFAVYALSSYDRDLIADSIVQTLAMGDLTTWTEDLRDSIYDADPTTDIYSIDHMINLNTDEIQGMGETQQIAPWMPEDVMVYQTGYRIGIFGEFLSLTPTTGDLGLVERVETYPYMGDLGDPVPEPDDSGPDHIQGTADDIPDDGPWE